MGRSSCCVLTRSEPPKRNLFARLWPTMMCLRTGGNRLDCMAMPSSNTWPGPYSVSMDKNAVGMIRAARHNCRRSDRSVSCRLWTFLVDEVSAAAVEGSGVEGYGVEGDLAVEDCSVEGRGRGFNGRRGWKSSR